MSAPRRRASAAAAGLVLVAAGLVLWVLSHVVATHEQHSFTSGAAAPQTVPLHAGRTYHLAVPGGVAAVRRVGVAPQSLQCTAQFADGLRPRLSLSVESSDTKATDQIASFMATATGAAHIACTGLGEVYVDNVSGDPSGYLLLLATAALVVGAPLLLSGLRGRRSSPASVPEVTAAAVVE